MTTSTKPTSLRRVLVIEPVGGGKVRLRLNCGHAVIRRDSYKQRKPGQLAKCPTCGAKEKPVSDEDDM